MNKWQYIVYTKGMPGGDPKAWIPTVVFTFEGGDIVDVYPIKNPMLWELAWAEVTAKADQFPDQLVLKKAGPKEVNEALKWLSASFEARNGSTLFRRYSDNISFPTKYQIQYEGPNFKWRNYLPPFKSEEAARRVAVELAKSKKLKVRVKPIVKEYQGNPSPWKWIARKVVRGEGPLTRKQINFYRRHKKSFGSWLKDHRIDPRIHIDGGVVYGKQGRTRHYDNPPRLTIFMTSSKRFSDEVASIFRGLGIPHRVLAIQGDYLYYFVEVPVKVFHYAESVLLDHYPVGAKKGKILTRDEAEFFREKGAYSMRDLEEQIEAAKKPPLQLIKNNPQSLEELKKEIWAAHHPELTEDTHVYILFSDGEISITKAGRLLWQRGLHMVVPGVPDWKLPFEFPKEMRGYGFIYTSEKEAYDLSRKIKEYHRESKYPPYLPNPDLIPGGMAEGMKPSDFDPRQLQMGIKEEMEHTTDPMVAREIAMDHLVEDPLYYTKLKKMGL